MYSSTFFAEGAAVTSTGSNFLAKKRFFTISFNSNNVLVVADNVNTIIAIIQRYTNHSPNLVYIVILSLSATLAIK
ncbi:IPT/TIG domain-containing protein [Brachyspira intermedia]|uniref:IPT/TIG domain-containing protein n=1 Tax=Brachyspira intermedia TaxID=84377 RepID=UPI003B59ECDB